MSAFETISARLELAAEGFQASVGDAVQSLGSLESTAGGAHKAVGALGVALAGGAAVALGSAAKSAAEFEEQMIGVEKVTDPQTADRMADAIQRMAGEAMGTHEELATIAETAGRLGVEGDQLEGFTETVAKMASSTDLAAEEAADAFARISTLMDIPIEDADRLGSAINELANNFGTSSSEITDVMTRAGSAFNALGLAEDEALGLAAAMNEVSPSSRLAAGGLKRMSEALMDPGMVDDIASALGMTTEEFQAIVDESPQEAIMMVAGAMDEGGQASTDLRQALGKTAGEFGTLGANLDNVDAATESAGDQFENATSLEEEFAAATSTFNSQLQAFRNQLRNVAIQTGEVLLPYLASFLDVLSGGLGVVASFNAKFDGLPAVLALVGTLVGGLAMAAGSLSAVIGAGGLATAVTAASGALGGLATAFTILTGPIGIAAAAVAGLAYLFYNDFAGIRTQTMRVVAAFREHLGPVIDRTVSLITTIISDLSQVFDGFGGNAESSIARIVSAVGDWLVGAIVSAFSLINQWLSRAHMWWILHGDEVVAIVQHIAQVVSIAFSKIVSVIRTAISVARSILGPFIAWFRELWAENGEQVMEQWSLTWARIKEDLADFVEWARPYVALFIELLSHVIRTTLTELREFWDIWGADIMSILRSTFETVKLVVEGAIDFIATTISVALAIIRGDWETAWELVEGFARRTVSRIADFIGTWKDTIVGIIDTAVGRIVDLFQWLYDTLVGSSIVPDMLADILSVFKDIIGKILDAIGDFVGDGVQAFKDFASDALDALKDKVSDFKSAGKSLITAVGDGIKSADIKDKVKGAAQKVRDYWPRSPAKYGPLSDIDKIGPALLDELIKGIRSNTGKLASATESAASAARNPLQDIIDTHGEFSGKAAIEAAKKLNLGQRHELANALADTKWFDKNYEASAALRKAAEGDISQQLYDALISQSGVYGDLERLLKQDASGIDRSKMVQAEDKSWVDPSFYGKNQGRGRDPPLIDFSNVDDDKLISVGDLKRAAAEHVKQDQRTNSRSSTTRPY